MLRSNNSIVIYAALRGAAAAGRMIDVTEPEPLFELLPSDPAGPGFAEMAAMPLEELVASDWARALSGARQRPSTNSATIRRGTDE